MPDHSASTTRPQSVGVIGAGVSGVATAAHLRAAGIDVVVFERTSVSGGVWVYDSNPPPEPHYPAMKPSRAESTWPQSGDEHKNGEKHRRDSGSYSESCFAPPGPCYDGLRNNVPTSLLRMSLSSWQDGTEDIVPHQIVKEYIQTTAVKTGVDDIMLYNTRVDSVTKQGDKWQVHTTTLLPDTSPSSTTNRSWEFDAVVVASGHYHACKVPAVPGLDVWKKSWPSRIQHSKSFRTAESYRDQNVLLVGAGTSSMDIARELGPVAKNIYQVSRGGAFDFSPIFLPKNAKRVGAIESFELNLAQIASGQQALDTSDPIPGTIVLKSGQRLSDIHRIILCTGYHFCLPFLQRYHEDDTTIEDASDTVLVTDGTQLHNLHEDIFYIPDSTLAFIGVPFYTATFTLFEFQAMALAAVWSGRADLPRIEIMRAQYVRRTKEKGLGRNFHSLKGVEDMYVRDLMVWLNRDAEKRGAQVLQGHTEEWHASRTAWQAKLKLRQQELELARNSIVQTSVQEQVA